MPPPGVPQSPRTRRGGGDVYGPGVAGLRRDRSTHAGASRGLWPIISVRSLVESHMGCSHIFLTHGGYTNTPMYKRQRQIPVSARMQRPARNSTRDLLFATSEAPEDEEPAPARRRTEGSGERVPGPGSVRAGHGRRGSSIARAGPTSRAKRETEGARGRPGPSCPVPVGGFGRGGTGRVYGARRLRCSVRRGRGRRGLRQRGGSRDPRSSRRCRRARTRRG